MLNSTNVCHNSASRRRRFRIVWVCVGLGALAGLGIFLWDSHGKAAKLSRAGRLVFLRHELLACAQREGKYPLDLQQVVRPGGLVEDLVDYRNVVYAAAGKPYDPQATQFLFYELKAQRYGFEVGRFEFYQNGCYFVRE